MSLDLSSHWNIIDQMIFMVEKVIKTILDGIHNSSSEEPDVELMIAAATEYLQHENERLKKREMPVYLVEEENRFICPKCQAQQQNSEVKYCFNCGHRVIRRMTYTGLEKQMVETP